MEGLPGPLKQLKLNLGEAAPPEGQDSPKLGHVPAVDTITDKHKWVVAALESGFKQREVAKMFGISEQYVGAIALWRHPELDEARAEARSRMGATVVDLTQRIKHHATEALERTVDIMRGPDISNARLAAKDIMDRAGYAPVKKVADVSEPVPSHEFVAAVERMQAVEEVRVRKVEWAFKDPRQTAGPQQAPQLNGTQLPASANIALPSNRGEDGENRL